MFGLRAAPTLAASLLLTLVAACSTTGDPRQGGLFGWNEDQAKTRQDMLRRDDESAKHQAAAESERGAALRNRQQGLSSEAGQLKIELDRLLNENTDLESRLRELMTRRQVGGAELVRLRQVLADNERLRSKTRLAALNSGTGSPTPVEARTVNDLNGRLHREVLILLQP